MPDTAHDRGDVLFLALTRPALMWGVPLEGLLLNAATVFFLGVTLKAPTVWRSPVMFWALAIPVHMAMRELTSWDYHWSRTLILSLRSLALGSKLVSLPRGKPKTGQELSSSV